MNDDSIFDECSDPGCPAHTRQDQEEWDVEYEDYYAITYVEDYCVVTDGNPVFDEPIIRMEWEQTKGGPCPKWLTRVIKVDDKTLLEVLQRHDESVVVWMQEYTTYDIVWEGHHMIVDAVENDMLDLSKPAFGSVD